MHRHEWYQRLFERMPQIEEAGRSARRQLGLGRLATPISLYSGMSSSPAPLPTYVLDAIAAANKHGAASVQSVEDEIRSLVKDAFGDSFDSAVVNTCESALRVALETLVAPPFLRRGESYRARMLFPYGEDADWGAAYGRAFPPKYKNVSVDRSVSSGELGMEAKCLPNLDTLFAPFAGARYEVHGIRQNVVPFLLDVDEDATMASLEALAARHGDSVAGVHAIGYDTPAYGYSRKDDLGRPLLMRRFGDLARRYDVPFIVDSASAIPILGQGPAAFNADVQVWSMDKVARAPTSGLIVGRETAILPIRKALGLAGDRFGNVSSHGKAAFSAFDPGRTALVGTLAALKMIRAQPETFRKPIDGLYELVVKILGGNASFGADLTITRSYHLGGVEVSYLRGWREERRGIPIFTLEDLYAQTNPICRCMAAMGLQPPPIYAGNIMLTPGLGLLDDEGVLIRDHAETALAALGKAIEITCEQAEG